METHPIAATLEHAELLSAYLHDATFLPYAWHVDESSGRFTLDLQRIWHERAKAGRAFLIVPVVRYPAVASRLTVTDVVAFHTECWPRDSAAGPRGEYLLLTIDSDAKDTLSIHTGGMVLKLQLSATSRILIEDFPDEAVECTHTDIGRRMRFPLMDDINRLRD